MQPKDGKGRSIARDDGVALGRAMGENSKRTPLSLCRSCKQVMAETYAFCGWLG
jgi:hypothetical protein